MANSINTNIPALNNQRALNQSLQGLHKAIERIATGKQINSALDDAAGLAIANRFTTQINGYNTAIRNAQDGISLAQTAEGALGGVTENLQRLRELSLQAANGSLSASDRRSLQSEADQLLTEINRTTQTTTFNDVNVLAQDTELNFQVGANAGERITVNTRDVGAALNEQGLNNVDISTQQGANDALAAIDDALAYIDEQRANLGAVQNRFETTISNLSVAAENASASRSRIEDADIAKQVSELTKNKLLQQIGIATQAQTSRLPLSALGLLKQ